VSVALLPLVLMGMVGEALLRPCGRVILVNLSGHVGSGRTEIRADQMLSFSSRVLVDAVCQFCARGWGWRIRMNVPTCSRYFM